MIYNPHECTLCPRGCRADRTVGAGFCRAPDAAAVERVMLHRFEEPVISGNDPSRGSGAVFFGGCTMRCVYCQNSAISRSAVGERLSPDALARLFLSLRKEGAYNINLVSPTPYTPYILDALGICAGELEIPVVWNTGGYETPETVRAAAQYVGVWLADVKYASGELSAKYSAAPDYPDRAFRALRTMADCAGAPEFYTDGTSRLIRRGVIVRHLCLPGHRRDTEAVLRRLAAEFDPGEILLSLMNQYTPGFAPPEYKNLSRRLTTYEYECALELADKLGFEGFSQERSSSTAAYTPDFRGDESTGENFR